MKHFATRSKSSDESVNNNILVIFFNAREITYFDSMKVIYHPKKQRIRIDAIEYLYK